MIYYCIFLDWTYTYGSSGKTNTTPGRFEVIVREIPPDAPQDWNLGPKQTPGMWGAYRYNEAAFPGRLYAYATGKTADDAMQAAGSWFKFQVGPWSKCKDQKSLEASRRYRA